MLSLRQSRPADACVILRSVRLDCRFHLLWRRWNVLHTSRGPCVRPVGPASALARRADAVRHEALALARSRQGARHAKSRKGSRGRLCGDRGCSHRCGRPWQRRRGRRHDRCGTAVTNRTRGDQCSARCARRSGCSGRCRGGLGRWRYAHATRPVEALRLLRDRDSAAQSGRERMRSAPRPCGRRGAARHPVDGDRRG